MKRMTKSRLEKGPKFRKIYLIVYNRILKDYCFSWLDLMENKLSKHFHLLIHVTYSGVGAYINIDCCNTRSNHFQKIQGTYLDIFSSFTN